MEYKIDFDALEWSFPISGVRHKKFSFQNQKLRLVEYTPDMEPHWCDRGHAGYILEGQLQIEFEDGTRVFNAGDGIVIPDGPDHKHKATIVSRVVRAVFIEKD